MDNTESKGQKKAKREIYSALHKAQVELKLTGRISRRGAPYLLGTLPNGRQYSVCYFRRHHSYTVFFPFGEWSEQEKWHVKDCSAIKAVVDHLIEENVDQEVDDVA